MDQPARMLRPPNRARLVDDVRASLEEAILAGAIKPGERLLESQLADELAVSRTTIREALLMLEHQGLVESRARRGTFVTRLSPDDALDVGFARALLEAYAVRVGFERIDAALLLQLENIIAAMGRCSLPGDVPRLVQLDTDFHRLLVEGCGARRIVELWASLSGPIRALYITTLENEHATIDYVVEFHRTLLEALRSGDPQIAQNAVIRHYARVPEHDAHAEALRSVVSQLAPALLIHAGAVGAMN